MKEVLYIFIGSGLGGVTRYLLTKTINNFPHTNFPVGTLTVNILACLLLGIIVGLADYKQLLTPQSRLFWIVGFCGGFSTFSAFSNEALTLLKAGLHYTNIAYLLSSITLCMAAVYVGIWLVSKAL